MSHTMGELLPFTATDLEPVFNDMPQRKVLSEVHIKLLPCHWACVGAPCPLKQRCSIICIQGLSEVIRCLMAKHLSSLMVSHESP